MLAETIKQHAFADAQAGNWSAVAATLQAISVTAEPRLCYAVESGDEIESAGDDPTTVLGYMLQDPNGNMLFQKLASTAGVMWAHDRTRQWLAWFVSQNRISQAGADALIDLSAPVTYPHAEVTAEQCEAAWDTNQHLLFLERLQERFDSIKNQIGTSEQPQAADQLEAMAAELRG
jgi:hypothetical protein